MCSYCFGSGIRLGTVLKMTSDARQHGGPDAFGTPRLDFSSNSNGCGPCPAALAAVAATDATAYPDPAYTALRDQLADWHGVAPPRIVIAGSASEFIFRISGWVAATSKQKTVSLPQHGYGDYAAASLAHGLHVTADAQDPALVWCCDPSSPLGQPQADLSAVLQAKPGRTVVLDRAYEPLRLGAPFAFPPDRLDAVWQLWSPNKAMGLTGVRGAYAIAPDGADDAVRALNRLAPSWVLGAHGVALLSAWATRAAQAWLAGSLVALAAWKQRQVAWCESAGWRCEPGVANFFCARPPVDGPRGVARLLTALRGHGIKLRDCASFGLPGLVRLAVLPPEAQDELAAAWDTVRSADEVLP